MREDLWEAQQRILAWGWPGAGRTSSRRDCSDAPASLALIIVMDWLTDSSKLDMSHSSYLTVLSPSILYKDCDKRACFLIWRINVFKMWNDWQNFVSSFSEKKNIGGTDWILPNIIGSGIGYRAGYRVLHNAHWVVSFLPPWCLSGRECASQDKNNGVRIGYCQILSGIGYRIPVTHGIVSFLPLWEGVCLSILSPPSSTATVSGNFYHAWFAVDRKTQTETSWATYFDFYHRWAQVWTWSYNFC